MFRNKIVLLQFLSLKKPQNNQYRKIDLKGFCLKFFFAVVHLESTLSV